MQTTLSIDELRAELTGPVIGPDDPDYDTARSVVLRSADRRPTAIIRPVDAEEVSRVVSLARDSSLELAVRSGGHSYAGHSTTEGGIVLDLRGITGIEIDPEERIVRAGGGLTSGDVTNALTPHGLTVGFGDTPTVGIGGITLGGGAGYLVRKHGLTIDQLLGAQVVTADGQVLEVDETREPDLFWAIRGGGGNFGVVTRFDYRLQPVDTVTGGLLAMPATAETLAGLVEAASAAPDALSLIANVLAAAPPMPFVPAELVGTPLALVLLVYDGPREEAEQAVAPLRALAPPIADFVREMPYNQMFAMEAPEAPPRALTNTFFSDRLDENDAAELLGRMQASTALLAAAQIRVLGGAVSRVPSDATAYAHRQRPLLVNVAAIYAAPDEDALHRSWADDAAAALRHGEDGAYVNFLGDEGPERVRAAYPGSTWDRLVEIKAHYDPDNVFRINQNVVPR
jgi:FAD/FMN-containing dehydrogenase